MGRGTSIFGVVACAALALALLALSAGAAAAVVPACETSRTCIELICNGSPKANVATDWLVAEAKHSSAYAQAVLTEVFMEGMECRRALAEAHLVRRIGRASVGALSDLGNALAAAEAEGDLRDVLAGDPAALREACQRFKSNPSRLMLHLLSEGALPATDECEKAFVELSGSRDDYRSLEALLALRNKYPRALQPVLRRKLGDVATSSEVNQFQCEILNLAHGVAPLRQTLLSATHAYMARSKDQFWSCGAGVLLTEDPSELATVVDQLLKQDPFWIDSAVRNLDAQTKEALRAELQRLAATDDAAKRLAATAELIELDPKANIPELTTLPAVNLKDQASEEDWSRLLCHQRLPLKETEMPRFADVAQSLLRQPSGRAMLKCLVEKYPDQASALWLALLANSPPEWIWNDDAAETELQLGGPGEARLLRLAIERYTSDVGSEVQVRRERTSLLLAVLLYRFASSPLTVRQTRDPNELQSAIRHLRFLLKASGAHNRLLDPNAPGNVLLSSAVDGADERLTDEIQARRLSATWQWLANRTLFAWGILLAFAYYLLVVLVWWWGPKALLAYGVTLRRVLPGSSGRFPPTAFLKWVLLPTRIEFAPRTLDAWIAGHLSTLKTSFQNQRLVDDRRKRETRYVYVDGERRDIDLSLVEWASVDANKRHPRLAIVGEGGIGKTTELVHAGLLALGFQDGPHDTEARGSAGSYLFGIPVIPVLIDGTSIEQTLGRPSDWKLAAPDPTAVLLRLAAAKLRQLTADPRFRVDMARGAFDPLVRHLARRRRMVILLDGVSEWNPRARQTLLQACADNDLVLIALTCRGRLEADSGLPTRVLELPLLAGADLTAFVFAWCRRHDINLDQSQMHALCADITREVGASVTALTAAAYLAVRNQPSREGTRRPKLVSVRDVVLEYLAFLNRDYAREAPSDQVQRDVAALAWNCWSPAFAPHAIGRAEALAVLSVEGTSSPPDRLNHLIEKLMLVETVGGDLNSVRIRLDPFCERLAAEHLASDWPRNRGPARAALAATGRGSPFARALFEALGPKDPTARAFLLAPHDMTTETPSPAPAPRSLSRVESRSGLPADLCQAYGLHALSVFVGAGASLSQGVGGAFPLWKELPNRLLIQLHGRPNLDPNLLPALTNLFNCTLGLKTMLSGLGTLKVLLGSEYQPALNAIFRPASARPGPLHQQIARLGCRAVLTSNFDNLLEAAEPPTERQMYTWRKSEKALLDFEGARKILFKIHGTAEDEDSVVMTTDEYERATNHDAYRRTLEQLVQRTTLLFVGFSMNDPLDLDLVLSGNAAIFKEAARKHYVLLKTPSPTYIDRLLHEFNAVAVPYAQHSDVVGILRKLEASKPT